jgi:hypothetical protein
VWICAVGQVFLETFPFAKIYFECFFFTVSRLHNRNLVTTVFCEYLLVCTTVQSCIVSYSAAILVSSSFDET